MVRANDSAGSPPSPRRTTSRRESGAIRAPREPSPSTSPPLIPRTGSPATAAGTPSILNWHYAGPGATPININPNAPLLTSAQAITQFFSWFQGMNCLNLATCQVPLADADSGPELPDPRFPEVAERERNSSSASRARSEAAAATRRCGVPQVWRLLHGSPRSRTARRRTSSKRSTTTSESSRIRTRWNASTRGCTRRSPTACSDRPNVGPNWTGLTPSETSTARRWGPARSRARTSSTPSTTTTRGAIRAAVSRSTSGTRCARTRRTTFRFQRPSASCRSPASTSSIPARRTGPWARSTRHRTSTTRAITSRLRG